MNRNSKCKLRLLNRAFADEIAKNRDFYGGEKSESGAVYHRGVYHDGALRAFMVR